VFRFLIDFELGMVGTHVALPAGTGFARDRDGTGVAGVARGAIADGAVLVWLADSVALLAPAGHGRGTFERGEGMRRAVGVAGVELFGIGDLFAAEPFRPVDRRPGDSSVATAEKLLIDGFVTATAISRGELGGDGEAAVFFALLICRGLMAFQTTDVLCRVDAHFIFVNDGILQTGMAFGTSAGSPNGGGVGLVGFRPRSCAIEEKCGQYQTKAEE